MIIKQIHTINKIIIYSAFILISILAFDKFNNEYLKYMNVFIILTVINLVSVTLYSYIRNKEIDKYYLMETINALAIFLIYQFITIDNFGFILLTIGFYIFAKSFFYILKGYKEIKNFVSVILGIMILVVRPSLGYNLSILTIIVLSLIDLVAINKLRTLIIKK